MHLARLSSRGRAAVVVSALSAMFGCSQSTSVGRDAGPVDSSVGSRDAGPRVDGGTTPGRDAGFEPGDEDAGPPAGRTSLLIIAAGQLEVAERNETTGRFTQLSGATPGGFSGGYGLAAHPTGRFVYTADPEPSRDTEIYRGAVNVAAGTVTAVDADPATERVDGVEVGQAVNHLVIDPTGQWMIAVSEDASPTWSLRVADDGALTPTHSVPLSTGAARPVFSRDGRRLYVPSQSSNAVDIVDFDPATGHLTLVDTNDSLPGAQGFAAPRASDVTVHPTLDVLYVAETGGIAVVAVGAGGVLTRSSTTPLAMVFGCEATRDGTHLYCGADPGGVTHFRIDAAGALVATGEVSAIPTGSTNGIYHFRFDAAERFLYVGTYRKVDLFERASSTGALTHVEQVPFGYLHGPLAIVP